MATESRRKELILRSVAQVINVVMVLASFFLVTNDLLLVALIVFLVSKWRMFATRPGLWLLNIRNSLCDILFGLSTIILMDYYHEIEPRLTLALAVGLFIWQLIVKPLTSLGAIKLQALLCAGVSFTAIWTLYPAELSQGFMAIVLSMVAGYAVIRHVFRQVSDDTLPQVVKNALIAAWLFLITQFAWLSWLWNISYELRVSELRIPLIAILVSLTFYFLGSILFYVQADKEARSPRSFMIQQTVTYSLLAALIVVLTEWNASIQ